MFKKGFKVLSKVDLAKKINWQLKQNFFTLTEVQSFSLRKLSKTIKLIAKVDGLKLKRKEAKQIALFLKSNFAHSKTSAEKLWSFIKNYAEEFKVKLIKQIISFSQIWLTSYQQDRYEIMRN